jgi:HEAT repeat protein
VVNSRSTSGASEPDQPESSGAVHQPATEPPQSDVTGRRRSVAVAGHIGDEQTARGGLTDPAPVVRVTALGALDRLGVLGDDELSASLSDPDPAVRRRACELAATYPGCAIASLLADPDASVVEMAAWALGEREDPGAVPALRQLAESGSGHGDPLCREAAVAALGAIGDDAGLPTILAALNDKPAIRRRAAVALAAFEGPEVEAALHRCLDDRDWQVRQVAEDLLATS